MESHVRVALADREAFARNLLRTACAVGGIAVVAETASVGELVDLCRRDVPHVAVVAGSLGDDVVDLCVEELRGMGVPVVVLSDDRSPERQTSVLARGAAGYLLHDTSPTQVVEAIRAVAGGAAALDPSVAATILEQWRWFRDERRDRNTARGIDLTVRERDVLRAMADGLATKAIALRLGIAVKTVENHKIRVFDKLGVRTQAHAVSMAIGQGLLTEPADTAIWPVASPTDRQGLLCR